MEPMADGSVLQYTDSKGNQFIFETACVEIDHSEGTSHYRPEPGTLYRVYHNINGEVFLKLSEFQHERIIIDLCRLPHVDVLAKLHSMKIIV